MPVDRATGEAGSRPLRVAMIGSGRSAHTLARASAVAARGHEVRLVTLGDVLPSAGIEVRTRPLPRSLVQAVGAARRFREDVRAFCPDLLHLHYAGGRLGTMATLTGVRPLAVTVMGGDVLPEQHEGGLGALERRATRRILQQADVIFAKADALRPAIVASGGSPERIETVRWGVDAGRFRRDAAAAAALRARLGVAPGARVLLSSRLLRPLYNVDRVVAAMPAILARVPEALLIATDYNAEPRYRSRIERQIEALGLQRAVSLIDRVGHAEMPALYSLAEVAVSVPRSDGLPQTLFEAMACGTPVVLSRLPAYGEVVRDGETALLAGPEPEAIASAVLRLLEDGELRRSLAEAALARVRQVASLPAELERVERAYRRALASPLPRSRQPLQTALDVAGLALR